MKTDSKNLWKQMLKSSLYLSLVTVIGISIVVEVHNITKPKIALAHKQKLLHSFQQIIPKNEYDNYPLKDILEINSPNSLKQLGHKQPFKLYRLRKNNKPLAIIFPVLAPDGYNGDITILIGIYYTGNIAGVRILEHRETPGLGDKIEIKKNSWILAFKNKKLNDNNISQWEVKKHGGMFDQFTGATITPKAVVKAIKKSLIFVQEQREKLYE